MNISYLLSKDTRGRIFDNINRLMLIQPGKNATFWGGGATLLGASVERRFRSATPMFARTRLTLSSSMQIISKRCFSPFSYIGCGH